MCNHLRNIMKNQIVPAATAAPTTATTAISDAVSILFILSLVLMLEGGKMRDGPMRWPKWSVVVLA